MRKLILSNSYDYLFECFSESYSKGKPFEKHWVLVPSFATQYDLQKRLAQKVGIAMGLKFSFIEPGLNQLLKESCPTLNKKTLCDELLIILEVLQSIEKDPTQMRDLPLEEQVGFQRYFEKQTGKKQVQLASALVHLFGYYALNSPTLLTDWLNKKAKTWQQFVFQKSYDKDSFWLNPNQVFNDHLNEKALKGTLHLFIPPYLSKFHQRALLEPLAHYNQILYHQTPSNHYWGDFKDPKEKSYFINAHKSSSDLKGLEELIEYMSLDHDLLSHFGKINRKFNEEVESFPFDERVEHFDSFLKETEFLSLDSHDASNKKPLLLDHVKSDLLSVENPQEVTDLPEDDSIEILAAPSVEREVEVLKGKICRLLQDDPSIPLDGIAILVANIEDYLPYIEHHFDSISDKIPYVIHDQTFEFQNHFLKVFMLLMNAMETPLSAKDWIQLIQYPDFILSQQLGSSQINDLTRLIHLLGIRNDVNGNLPFDDFITELLLRLIEGDKENLNDPFLRQMGFSDLKSINQFLNVFENLKADLNLMQSPEKASFLEWSLFLSSFVDSYFLDVKNENIYLTALKKKIEEWGKKPEEKKAQSYTFIVFWNLLKSDLANFHTEVYGQKGEKLSFYSIHSTPLISSDYTFVLGLDEDNFPRNPLKNSLDYLATFSKHFYVPKQVDLDRSYFLMLLLNTQKQLTISYQNLDPKTHKAKQHSLIIEELMSYLDKNYTLSGQKVSEKNFKQISLLAFDANALKASYALPGYYEAAKDYYDLEKNHQPNAFFHHYKQKQLSTNQNDFDLELEKLSIQQMALFLKNPFHFYLQDQFKIQERKPFRSNDFQGFVPSLLQKSRLKKQLLDEPLDLKLEPFLAHQYFSEVTSKELENEEFVKQLYMKKAGISLQKRWNIEMRSDHEKTIKEFGSSLLAGSYLISLDQNEIHLEGVIENVCECGILLTCKPTFSNIWSRLPNLIISQLIFEKMGWHFETQFHFIYDDQLKRFEIEDPDALLKKLTQFFLIGMKRPLLFIPDWIPYWVEKSSSDCLKKIKGDLVSRFFNHELIQDAFHEISSFDEGAVEELQILAKDLLSDLYGIIQQGAKLR